ncbi:MAG: GH3 auxin-responsive promoter family protein [Alphaproteobacteria bacterium]|nr:GH3 auxin-responsive promoter family protein [Alphaproteobacteria bacterium]
MMRPPFPPDGNGPYRVLRGFARPAVEALHEGLEDPRAAQAKRLAAILDNARGTAFAQDHGLRGDEDLEAFRAAVPVRDYDGHRPWLDRVVAGESGVVSRAKVQSLLKTSGTTGASKLLPVTDPYAAEVAAGQALWRLALIRDHEGVTKGGALTLVSPAVEGYTAGGLPFGSNTGRMHEAQPWVVRLRYPVPSAVYRIHDSELRLYCALRFALQSPLSSITTANPSTLLLLCRRLMEHREALSADLADGTLNRGPAEALGKQVRRRLRWHLRRRRPPQDWRPARLWDLVTVNCWKGGPARYFLDQLPEALGGEVTVREVGITASEGYFAIPLSDEGAGGVAWLGGHVLEFIDEDGAPRWAWELEQGRAYRLVVTTSGGLFRYDLNDILEVTGFLGKAPVLRFLRKGGNVLSMTGEKVTEDQIVSAMRAALGGARPRGFTVGYRLRPGEAVPALTLAVEGSVDEALPERLDAALRAGNIEYESKRESGRLGPPCLLRLPEGSYARYRAARVAQGAPDGQVKDLVVALSDAHWRMLLGG